MFISFFPALIFLPIKQALLVSVIVGGVFGIFCAGFMERALKREVLILNASTINPQKSLRWYEEQIRMTLLSLHFRYLEARDGIEIYKPQGVIQILEPYVELEVTTYEISLKGSRMFCRIISDLKKPAFGSE